MLFDFLRDPIVGGIGLIIASVSALLGLIFFFFPDSRETIRIWGRRLLSSIYVFFALAIITAFVLGRLSSPSIASEDPVEITRLVEREIESTRLVTVPAESDEVVIITTTPLPTYTPFPTLSPLSTYTPYPVQEPIEVTREVVVTVLPPTPTPSATPSALFTATFDEDPIFDLTDTIRLAGGKLTVTANKGEWVWLPIPGFSVGEDFYFQAEMQKIDGHSCYMGIGLGLGDSFSYHSFMLTGGCGAGATGFYDNRSPIFRTPNSSGVTNDANIIGLESKDGFYTLFVNGTPLDKASVDRYGNQVGLVIWKYQDGYPSYVTVTIDNIIVREQR